MEDKSDTFIEKELEEKLTLEDDEKWKENMISELINIRILANTLLTEINHVEGFESELKKSSENLKSLGNQAYHNKNLMEKFGNNLKLWDEIHSSLLGGVQIVRKRYIINSRENLVNSNSSTKSLEKDILIAFSRITSFSKNLATFLDSSLMMDYIIFPKMIETCLVLLNNLKYTAKIASDEVEKSVSTFFKSVLMLFHNLFTDFFRIYKKYDASGFKIIYEPTIYCLKSKKNASFARNLLNLTKNSDLRDLRCVSLFLKEVIDTPLLYRNHRCSYQFIAEAFYNLVCSISNNEKYSKAIFFHSNNEIFGHLFENEINDFKDAFILTIFTLLDLKKFLFTFKKSLTTLINQFMCLPFYRNKHLALILFNGLSNSAYPFKQNMDISEEEFFIQLLCEEIDSFSSFSKLSQIELPENVEREIDFELTAMYLYLICLLDMLSDFLLHKGKGFSSMKIESISMKLIVILNYLHNTIPMFKSLKDFKPHPLTLFPTAKLMIIHNLTVIVEKNPDIQDVIREKNGLETILSCCKYDANNPFIRERCILCLKYLLKDNKENQDFIRSLETRGEVDEDELIKAGLEIKINDGKVVVSGK